MNVAGVVPAALSSWSATRCGDESACWSSRELRTAAVWAALERVLPVLKEVQAVEAVRLRHFNLT